LLAGGLTFRLPLALPLTLGPSLVTVVLLLELSGPVATRERSSTLALELDAPGPGGLLVVFCSQPMSESASAVAPAIAINLRFGISISFRVVNWIDTGPGRVFAIFRVAAEPRG